ncbi:deoxynucleoside kinase [Methanococcoides sp. SA1]|nr:deoxynucleoside kinase [Methanococcoides sp. SA1]
MSDKKYVFIGPAGSGKTTRVKKLIEKYDLVFYDIFEIVKPYLEERDSITDKETLDEIVGKYVDSFEGRDFDVIELASGHYLPWILDTLKGNEVKVVYCRCSIDTCKERMKERGRSVPLSYLEYHHKFGEEYYRELQEKYGFELVVVDTEEGVERNVEEIENKLNFSSFP